MSNRITALAVAFCLLCSSIHADDRETLASLEREGAVVLRDDSHKDSPVIGVQYNLRQITVEGNLALSELDFLPAVELIGSGDTEITVATLRALQGKSSLRTLSVSNAKISDAAAKVLGTLKTLENLQLRSQVEMSPQGCEEIFALTNLQELILSDRLVNDLVLEKLARLPRLKTLTIRSVFVTDEGIAALGQLVNLSKLHLYLGFRVSEAGVRRLVEFQLPEIELTYLSCTDEKLKELRKFSGLKALRLIGAENVTDEGIPYLSELTELKELDLSDAKLTMAGIKELKKALSNCRVVHDARKRN